jgi:hypothetical protein
MPTASHRKRTGRGILLLLVLALGCDRLTVDVVRKDAGLEIGTRLPSVLAGARMRNAPVGEPAPQGGWIVYAFSPLSPESERNQGRVEELARTLPRDWALLAMATDAQGVPAFCERLHVTVPVLTQVPAADLAAYRITGTPRTYVLDRDWKLLEVLDGPFEGEVAETLAARFPAGPGSGKAPDLAAGPPGGKPLPRGLCRDRHQGLYSRGSRADALGVQLQCGAEGLWVPAT